MRTTRLRRQVGMDGRQGRGTWGNCGSKKRESADGTGGWSKSETGLIILFDYLFTTHHHHHHHHPSRCLIHTVPTPSLSLPITRHLRTQGSRPHPPCVSSPPFLTQPQLCTCLLHLTPRTVNPLAIGFSKATRHYKENKSCSHCTFGYHVIPDAQNSQ